MTRAEKQKVYQATYNTKHADLIRERGRLRMQRIRSNPELNAKLNAYRRSHIEPNRREKLKAYHKKVKQLRFFHCRAVAFKHHYGSNHKASDLAKLWKSQRGHCALTGRKLTKYNAHLDHIVPVGRGGTSGLINLRWTVNIVNQAKRALLDTEFFDLCRSVISYAERLAEQRQSA